jgi:hypothetical protein
MTAPLPWHLFDLDLPPTGLCHDTPSAWELEARYETARLLAVIAERLTTIAEHLRLAGRGAQ